MAGAIWSAPATAALWLSAEPMFLSNCQLQRSQSGGVAAAVQISDSEWTMFIRPTKMSHQQDFDLQ
jgi:hypothetical protein